MALGLMAACSTLDCPLNNTVYTKYKLDGTVTELTYQDVKRVYDDLGGRVFTAKNDVGQVAVLNWHGNILIPFGPYYDYSVNTSNDGTMLLLQNKDTRNVEVHKLQ